MKQVVLWVACVSLALAAEVRGQNFWEQGRINPAACHAIAVTSKNTILAGTFGPGIYRSTDEGVTWKHVGLDAGAVFTIQIDDSARIFAEAGGYGVIRSTDDGLSWTQTNNGLGEFIVNSLAIDRHDDLYVGTYGGKVFKSNDHGDSWNRIDSFANGETGEIVAVLDNGNILASALGGALYRSSDGGHAWARLGLRLATDSVQALTSIRGIVLAGTDSGLFISTNNGNTWWPRNQGLPTTKFSAMYVQNDGTLNFATNNGVFQSPNYGATWTRLKTALPTQVTSFAEDSSGRFMVGTSSRGIFFWDSIRWKSINNGLPNRMIEAIANGSDGAVYVAVGAAGVFRSDDTGKSWIDLSDSLNGLYIDGLAITPNGHVFAGSATFGTSVLSSADRGSTWHKTSSVSDPYVNTIASDLYGNLYVGTGYGPGGLFLSTNEGYSWQKLISTRNSITGIGVSPCNNVVGVGSSLVSAEGQYWYSNNYIGGQSIAADCYELYIATYGNGAYRLASGSSSMTDSINKGLTNRYLQSIARNRDGKLFVATWGNGVYSSTDSGSNWTSFNLGLDYQWVKCLSFDSAGQIYAGTNYGGVFHSKSSTLKAGLNEYHLPQSVLNVFPNPLTTSTTIHFTLPKSEYITLTLYDISGREVRRVASGEMDAGAHDVPFERGDLPAGVYFYRLSAGGDSQMGSMVIE